MRTEPIGMAVAVLFLLASGQACAGTVGELAEIQAQAILTEAKVRLATAQRQLEVKGETGQVVSAQGQTFAMPVPAAAAAPTITQPVPPVVRTIYGAGGKMTATFLFPGGYEVDAASGAELPGNYRVESISLDQVVLTDKDGNRVPVGFSSVAPFQASSTAQGASVPPALPGAVPQPFIQ
ncbi:type IV pilus biogenesis protein PilP [Pseudomonas aeruginosa]|uniref:type IV pilus biogenesis protein PilP n=1 Tax=Pseudomonas aeruginosa TaxID=287 RepID=UPI001A24190E|nr:type IV pilus biogenesis protein PilP [Pseudomonas aeruginosa]